ncbi:MAG: hypothetical protein AB1942_21135 [Pseudomonadota bacterium]
MREIPIAGRPGQAVMSAPYQAEALTYFGRMTAPPSAAYRDAFNWAVWRWKVLGVWPLIKGLWLLSADTAQAGLLSAINDTARDAVVLGVAPTFAALKGFSGFAAGKQLRFPITSAILGSDNVYAFMAGRVAGSAPGGDLVGGPTIPFIISDAGAAGDAGPSTPGHFTLRLAGVYGAGPGAPITRGITATLVGGTKGLLMVSGGTAAADNSGSVGPRSSNYVTRSIDDHPLARLCSYGFLDAAATAAQCRQFTSVLAMLLEQLGALD